MAFHVETSQHFHIRSWVTIAVISCIASTTQSGTPITGDIWKDDDSLPTKNGWKMVDKNNHNVNYITNGDTYTYRGPYSGPNGPYKITQQFYCIHQSLIAVFFNVYFCATEWTDIISLYLNDQQDPIVNQGLDTGSTTTAPSYYDPSLEQQITCNNYHYYELGPYNISSVDANVDFKVQFQIDVSSNNEYILLRNIIIRCKEITTTTSPTSAPISTTTTMSPTSKPSYSPSNDPTHSPTRSPSKSPIGDPTYEPTNLPTYIPSNSPTEIPTEIPTNIPTQIPTVEPTIIPSINPSISPSSLPTSQPSEMHITTVSPDALNTSGSNGIDTEIIIIILVFAIMYCGIIIFGFYYAKYHHPKKKHTMDINTNDHYVQLMDPNEPKIFGSAIKSGPVTSTPQGPNDNEIDDVKGNDSDEDVLNEMITSQGPNDSDDDVMNDMVTPQ